VQMISMRMLPPARGGGQPPGSRRRWLTWGGKGKGGAGAQSGAQDALMSVFKGSGRVFSFVVLATVRRVMWLCKAGDGAAGCRLTFSDARIGYRLSGFRPGLSHSYSGHRQGRPPSVCSGMPHRGPVSSHAQRMSDE